MSPYLSSQQRKRTPEEVMSAILSVADGCSNNGKRGATKMKIMADAFISFSIATEYLGKLQQDGLIEYRADMHSYVTTDRGRQLIITWRAGNQQPLGVG